MPTFDPARLKALVAESGLSYRALAAAIDSNESNVSNIVNGHTTPQADTLAKILGAVGKRWKDLDEPAAKKGRKK